MFEKYLNNRFFILYVVPLSIGALTTLSFEPFNLTIINLIIFPIFFYLITYINKKSKVVYRKKPYKKNLFICGLLFGFGFYLSGIFWVTNSLTFDESFKILIPFALVLIPLFLSLFMAMTILIIGPHLRFDFPSLIIFSASLALSDYSRSYVLGGFPWNLWAYSSAWASEILQILNIMGLHSYNLLSITLYTLPIIFFKIRAVKKFGYLILTIFYSSPFVFGSYKINKNKKDLSNVSEKIMVKIVALILI